MVLLSEEILKVTLKEKSHKEASVSEIIKSYQEEEKIQHMFVWERVSGNS